MIRGASETCFVASTCATNGRGELSFPKVAYLTRMSVLFDISCDGLFSATLYAIA